MESLGAQPSITHLNSPEEEINVYLMIKKTIALNVKRSETIKNLKTMVHEKEGIAEDIQDLFFAGDRLTNGRLIDYGIERDSTLHLIPQNRSGLKLFVKMPTKETPIVVEAMAHHSVQKIKSLIQVNEGVQSDQFTLVYDGNLLEEDMTLASLNITSESKLQLVFCPREVLSISVKAPTGDIVKLKVKVLFTVDDVKEIVGNIIGISVGDQILTYAGKLLEGWNTLAFYDLKEDCMLEMLLPSLIEIFVKTPTEEVVKLKVKVLLTVRDVKAIVANMLSVSVVNHDLLYGGMKLEDFKTLACYDIKNDHLLEMVPVPFQIFVRTWNGKTITQDVRLCNTIKDVKVKLFEKLQIPPHLQSIVLAGKRLEDIRELASYNIQKHSTLHVVLSPSSRIMELPLNCISSSISLSTSISDVKDMAKCMFQAPVKELLFQVVVLEDDHTLADYVMDLSEEVVLVF